MQKLYCYVDETGQDTSGKLFLVSVVITEKEQQELRKRLETIESQTKKRFSKWIKTKKDIKQKYLQKIIETNLFINKIFFAQYTQTKAYTKAITDATAKVISKVALKQYEANVYIDGLSKSERRKFASGLRKLRIKVRKVRGARDQSEILIRLADAIAGFIRDYIEKEKYAQEFYQKAVQRKVIQEIK